MAGRPKSNTNTTETETKTIDNSAEIMAMLQSIKAELEKVKNENKTLKQENETLKNTPKDTAMEYDPNKLVTIRNVYCGEHITLFTNTAPIKMTKVNPITRVRLSDLEAMVRLNEGHFLKGRIAIEDKDILEEIFPQLGEVYKTMVDKNTLEQIADLGDDVLRNTFQNANQNFKKAIVDKWIKGYVDGENINYRSPLKIKIFSDIMQIDFMDMINGVMTSENLLEVYTK